MVMKFILFFMLKKKLRVKVKHEIYSLSEVWQLFCKAINRRGCQSEGAQAYFWCLLKKPLGIADGQLVALFVFGVNF